MARHRRVRRNRMPAGLARYWAKHRRNPRRRHTMRNRRRHVRRNRARRNYTSAGLVAMNPRRRSYRRNRVHRHHFRRNRARRNPSFMGFTLPPTMDLVMVGSGLILTPMVANYVFNSFVAGTSMGTSKWAYLATEAASAAALGFAVKKFVGSNQGNMILLGAGARVLIDAITILAPTLLPSTAMPTGLSGAGTIGQPFLGYYNNMPRRRMLGNYNVNPGLGYYNTRGVPMAKQGTMIQNIPARLDPAFRY